MSEWIRNAGEGWQRWNSQGKLMALFLAVLLLLWFGNRKYRQGVVKKLLIYTGILTVLAVIPVTAAILMAYQTKFYDYEWVWSLVPITAITAYGGVVLFTMLTEEKIGKLSGGFQNRKIRTVLAGLLLAVILFLSGNMGNPAWDMDTARNEKLQAQKAVELLREECPEELLADPICLWAPREILEYARMFDGDITLLYGRNMWDKALGAYSYDTYDISEELLYLWMEQAAGKEVPEGYVSQEAVESLAETDAVDCVTLARQKGANRMLLPGGLAEDELAGIKECFGQQIRDIRELDDYYLLYF